MVLFYLLSLFLVNVARSEINYNTKKQGETKRKFPMAYHNKDTHGINSITVVNHKDGQILEISDVFFVYFGIKSVVNKWL